VVATDIMGVYNKLENREGKYSVVVEEKDFDACGAIDNLGYVALHCLDDIHLLNSTTLPRSIESVEDFRV
jgi:hypothetical protein